MILHELYSGPTYMYACTLHTYTLTGSGTGPLAAAPWEETM